MTAKADVTLGLHATVSATRDEVVRACVRAASTLGFHGQSIVEPDRVVVKIFRGLVPDIARASPRVAISIEPLGDRFIVLDAKIVRYRTLQSKFFFIKLSPKRLKGKASYKKFLTSLEEELRSIDQGGGQFQWVVGTS